MQSRETKKRCNQEKQRRDAIKRNKEEMQTRETNKRSNQEKQIRDKKTKSKHLSMKVTSATKLFFCN